MSETSGAQKRKRKADEEKEDYELQVGPTENIGVGVAYTYFFGFLQIVIRGIWKNFKEAMASYGINDENRLVKKMLIIIRKSVNYPPKLEEPGVEQTKYIVKLIFNRAGKKRREYTLSIYKLADKDESENDFYFVADFPACLVALREACDYNLMSAEKVFEARKAFFQTVRDLLRINQAKFGNQWELVEWPDEGDHRMGLKEFLYQEIERRRLTVLTAESYDGIDQIVNPVDSVTFEPCRGARDNPLYADGEQYNLKYSNRGYCVIINNYQFYKKSSLKNLTGGRADIADLEKLFKTLKFEVRKHENLTSEAIKTELAKYSKMDHSESDAFVCCLLSHGNKGRICGKEGASISVIELMKLFYDEECPSLRGKPKLFFIEACQVGAEGAEEFSANVVRDLIPTTVDFIVSYACLPYTEAHHDKKKGGLYVRALCKHLIRDLEIDVALRHVNKEVRDRLKKYEEAAEFPIQDPFHIILPPQKFLFLYSI